MRQTAELFLTERQKLYAYFADRLETANYLNRKIVSFQGNKIEPVYRWFKYKEGFSASLVKYFLSEYSEKPGKLLDPFAGTGTALFAGQELGWQSYGIEILPVGIFVINARQALNDVDIKKLKAVINKIQSAITSNKKYSCHINHIPITKDAFSEETESLLNKYLDYCSRIEDKNIQTILRFAAFAVLEDVSYTRKDGQYLRWDYRSGRELSGKPFDKGRIQKFSDAIKSKLDEIMHDLSTEKPLSLFDEAGDNNKAKYPVTIFEGSSLDKLPLMEDKYFDFIITSPPYCNRYDYTRTYALELVYLGLDNDQVRNLRQSMLSCTVENKEKIDILESFYKSLNRSEIFQNVIEVYNKSAAMSEVNSALDVLNKMGKLNNNNIPRMVKNYFLELCFVIYEMSRVIKNQGHSLMVNDNVRYGGEEIPVDLILSEFAEKFGFNVKNIYVLPRGKGNSSQQMGNYGRTEIRKCVYVWQKN